MMSIEIPSQAKSPALARSKSTNPEGPPDDWRGAVRIADLALLIGFLSLTFLLGIFPLKDTDFWWHLRTGDLIRTTGQIPRVDIYLFTQEGTPWIDLHWLFQLAISWVHLWGGVVALNLAKCGVTTLAVFFLITARRRDWPLWVMVLAWIPALLVLNGRMYVRPETLSLLYMSIDLAILLRWHRHPRLAWLLPVVQLIWVNSHGLFVFGPILVGFALIDTALRRGAFAAGRGHWWKTILGASLATGLACLINPYGIVGAIYPIELASTMSNPIFSDNIAELKSLPTFFPDPGFRNVPLTIHVTTMALGALSFIIPFFWQLASGYRRGEGIGIGWLRDDADPNFGAGPRRKGASAGKAKPGSRPGRKGSAEPAPDRAPGWKLSPFRILLYVAFSLLSLKATRNSHQFAAVVGTVMSWNFGEWAAAVRRSRDRSNPVAESKMSGLPGNGWLVPRLSVLGLLAGLFVAVAGGWYYVLCGEGRTVGLGEEKLWFPHEAARFAGSSGMPERFLAFHVGHVSLLEYYNGPKKKGYVDARLEIVGPELFRRYLELENDIHPNPNPSRLGWESQLDSLGRPSVLVEHDLHAVTGATLLASQHWKCVWFDLVAALYVHDSYSGAVADYEVDFASRHFKRDEANEPHGQAELLALAKAARNYLIALPRFRERLSYPFIWAGLDAALAVIRNAPNTPEAWKFLGQVEMSREPAGSGVEPGFSLSFEPIRDLGPIRATYALRRATELIPDDFTLLMGLSNSFVDRRILAEALEILEHVGQLRPINKPQSEYILKSRGIAADIREEMGEAPSPEWHNLSELDRIVSKLITSGRIGILADVLEKAYPVERSSWDEVDRVATARLQLGQAGRARELWSRAKDSAKPGLRQARIALTYLAEGAFDEARRAYLEAIRAGPNLFEAHYCLAVLEQDAGRADEAHDHALKAMDISKNDKNRARYGPATAIAGRVSRFLTRAPKDPAIPVR